MLARLRLLTAGESHGPALLGILEGMPAGVPLDRSALRANMARRRQAAGRSARMQIEGDEIEVLGGVRHGRTLGSPIGFVIRNLEFERWRSTMAAWAEDVDAGAEMRPIAVPRPGHADFAGAKKLGIDDARDVLERASARETAARTAAGAFCRQLLSAVGIEVASQVLSIGGAVEEDAIQRAIDAARATGDTLGGVFEVTATGLPIGLGHYAHWDRRLSARLGEALTSIHAVRAVAMGGSVDAFAAASTSTGRAFHDAIASLAGERPTNSAGGVEGGMSNGMPISVRAFVKPLATVAGGLPSVSFATGEPARGHVERSDTTAVPAAAVVGEAMVCLVLADALLEKFGGDSLEQLRAHMAESAEHIDERP